jgi:hypothetical protein
MPEKIDKKSKGGFQRGFLLSNPKVKPVQKQQRKQATVKDTPRRLRKAERPTQRSTDLLSLESVEPESQEHSHHPLRLDTFPTPSPSVTSSKVPWIVPLSDSTNETNLNASVMEEPLNLAVAEGECEFLLTEVSTTKRPNGWDISPTKVSAVSPPMGIPLVAESQHTTNYTKSAIHDKAVLFQSDDNTIGLRSNVNVVSSNYVLWNSQLTRLLHFLRSKKDLDAHWRREIQQWNDPQQVQFGWEKILALVGEKKRSAVHLASILLSLETNNVWLLGLHHFWDDSVENDNKDRRLQALCAATVLRCWLETPGSLSLQRMECLINGTLPILTEYAVSKGAHRRSNLAQQVWEVAMKLMGVVASRIWELQTSDAFRLLSARSSCVYDFLQLQRRWITVSVNKNSDACHSPLDFPSLTTVSKSCKVAVLDDWIICYQQFQSIHTNSITGNDIPNKGDDGKADRLWCHMLCGYSDRNIGGIIDSLVSVCGDFSLSTTLELLSDIPKPSAVDQAIMGEYKAILRAALARVSIRNDPSPTVPSILQLLSILEAIIKSGDVQARDCLVLGIKVL